ncbi:MAG TPA: ChbG/HpnK family deacetylase, partial [Terriglobales bacterium]|nr:ChbG/HpnK family deacetylase [Terriglobales bacterium]
MRRLIINADDFGLTSGVNRAILEAYTSGVVTSATLMANSAAFDEAVHLALLTDQFEVGCHVVLVDGSPVSGTQQVPSLIDHGKGVHFRDSAGSLGLAAWAGKLDPGHIAAEATAQIGKLKAAGIPITHIDTHKHVHMFPKVLEALVTAAQGCGVRAIRNPFEPVRFSQFRASPKRWMQVKALNLLSQKFRQIVGQAGMVTTDGSLGVVATGSLDHTSFRDLVQNCPEGTWELVCHPGHVDRDLSNIRTRLRQCRAV